MSKKSKPIVGISVGDPNGIGIEVILKSLKDTSVLEKCSVVVFSNFKLIKNQMSYFNIDLPLKEVSHFNNYDERCINVHPINKEEIKLSYGKLTTEGGVYSKDSLFEAVKALKNRKTDALVTGPINKKNIQSDDFRFKGHTDFLDNEFQGESLMFMVSNEIKVPSFRHDIQSNNDLAEEIARVIGYDNIKSAPINLNKVIYDENQSKINKLESLLINNGFSEVINFPFTSKKVKKSITIDNPLDSNRGNFRTNLKDSLVENLLYNERRQKDSIKLFEISDIYTKDKEIIQQKKIGIIVSGRLGDNHSDFSIKLDKKFLDQLLNDGGAKENFEIIEISRDCLETKKKDKIYYIETYLSDIPSNFFLNLDANKKNINFISYKPFSEYPSSTRDFSFSIDNIHEVNNVIRMLDQVTDEIIKKIFMFDFYKNNKAETVKLGYRFIFQSNTKTLSEKEINEKIQEILNPILKIDGVSIPGM